MGCSPQFERISAEEVITRGVQGYPMTVFKKSEVAPVYTIEKYVRKEAEEGKRLSHGSVLCSQHFSGLRRIQRIRPFRETVRFCHVFPERAVIGHPTEKFKPLGF